MHLVVHLSAEAGDRPAAGTPVVVEVRDVSYADADSLTVASAVGRVATSEGNALASVELDVPDVPAQLSVWAHAQVAGAARVSKGDFITMQSYPVPVGQQPADLQVQLRRV